MVSPHDDWLSRFLTAPVPNPLATARYLTAGAVPPSLLSSAASRLRLDETRRGRIRSALVELERRIRADPGLGPLVRRFVVQGSYALDTTIRPRLGESFDVDVLVVMDVRRLPLRDITPLGVLSQVESAVRSFRSYDVRLTPRTRCMRLNYKDGFHVDLVPAHADSPYTGTSGPALIANRDRATWENTHPLGFQQWFDGRTNRARLRQIVILMKRWRDEWELQIPSMLLTTMIARAADVSGPSLERSVARTLAQLDASLSEEPRAPVVPNPSLPLENLARDWDAAAFMAFRDGLREASQIATAALTGPTARRAELWRELFGDVVLK